MKMMKKLLLLVLSMALLCACAAAEETEADTLMLQDADCAPALIMVFPITMAPSATNCATTSALSPATAFGFLAYPFVVG